MDVGFLVVGLADTPEVKVGLRVVGLRVEGAGVVGFEVVGGVVGFAVGLGVEGMHVGSHRHSAGNSDATLLHAVASLRHCPLLVCNHMILDPQLWLPAESVTILSQTAWVHELQPQYEVGVGGEPGR